jgi:2-oxoisovalerate dehydrogenase E1 component beta subunit
LGEPTYLEAIAVALRREMERDERVVLLGEDIGAYGGAFDVTAGLLERFGPARVIDTPLAEAAIVGASVGAAVDGLRPVAEMQFADFVANGFDQLVNVAAKMHYRQRQAVPMVLRLPSGGGFSGGPFHSQNPEAWLMQAPGLKVVAPSTPADALGLLTAAMRDPNPVVFLEHKRLYRGARGPLPEDDHVVELGRARIAREGREMTLVTYGAMVQLALDATAELGDAVEVVDLRSLVPLDREAIAASVAKTSRALILTEATRSAGAGAEVAALIADECFEDLDAPVRRLTAPDTPIPFSPPLEQAVLPQAEDVERTCRELLDH